MKCLGMWIYSIKGVNVLNEPKLKVHGTDEKNVTLDGSRMISILSKRISFPCFYITIVFKSNYLEYKVYKSWALNFILM